MLVGKFFSAIGIVVLATVAALFWMGATRGGNYDVVTYFAVSPVGGGAIAGVVLVAILELLQNHVHFS